jgi:predicted RNA-binding protein with PUA-like domain
LSAKYWLMKTEPETFSWQDLVRRPGRRESWDGVRNYQARNFMRDEFAEGHEVFIYHSSTGEPGIVGVARVARAAYPDPSALRPDSPYFDPKSAADGKSRWVMVDVEAVASFAETITLKSLREHPDLQEMALLQRGQRLSIQPVRPQEWKIICKMAKMIPVT